MDNLLHIGFINNVRGLKGELKVTHYCDYKEAFSELDSVVIDEEDFQIEYVKYHKEQVIIKLKGIDRVEDAENFKNKNVYAQRSQLPKLSEGQYYIADLIGLSVYTHKNEYVGVVKDVIVSTASDLLQIEKENKSLVLVPNIGEFVKSISIDDKKIIITPIEGLLE